MKKIVLVLTILLSTALGAFSAQTIGSSALPQASPQTASYAAYNSCIRQYNLPFEKLYYISLAAINSNRFNILEMQSRSGYILFETADKEFLLSVIKKDNKISFVKITPADNSYAFSPAIPQRIFSYIDLNFSTPVQTIK